MKVTNGLSWKTKFKTLECQEELWYVWVMVHVKSQGAMCVNLDVGGSNFHKMRLWVLYMWNNWQEFEGHCNIGGSTIPTLQAHYVICSWMWVLKEKKCIGDVCEGICDESNKAMNWLSWKTLFKIIWVSETIEWHGCTHGVIRAHSDAPSSLPVLSLNFIFNSAGWGWKIIMW